MDSLLQEVFRYAQDTYGTEPEYPWEGDRESAVLRRADNRKLYALAMCLARERLGLPGPGRVWVLNVKCSPVLLASLRGTPGYLPAYHMNKASWLTVLLDGTAPLGEVTGLLDLSYSLTGPKLRRRPPAAPL